MDNNKIITFGLSDKQNSIVANAFTDKNYEVFDTDCYTDVIAISAMVVIINSDMLEDNERECIIGYYLEVAAEFYQTIFWIGKHRLPKKLEGVVKYFDCFEKFSVDIKYHILESNRKYKKASDYSEKLADSMKILSEIRKHPYIQTKQLAEIIERSERTVIRYITSLRVAGEMIFFDNTSRGWYLPECKSILFGDY